MAVTIGDKNCTAENENGERGQGALDAAAKLVKASSEQERSAGQRATEKLLASDAWETECDREDMVA